MGGTRFVGKPLVERLQAAGHQLTLFTRGRNPVPAGVDPASVAIRSFDPAGLDKKARKAFPLRLAHFLTDITRVRRELAWEPEYDLEATLADSFRHDYQLRMPTSPDFSGDEALIGA